MNTETLILDDYNITNYLLKYVQSDLKPNTFELLYLIKISQPSEVNRNLESLQLEINHNTINTKEKFNKFLIETNIWENCKKMKELNIVNTWKSILEEKMDDIIIDGFKVKNIKKWLIEKNEIIKFAEEEYKKRIFLLLDIIN